ncbi:replicative DNA helicase [Candidatus Campbellbacteria bacterium]|nr:MAG: replicative DNA helicase [Candidatus Campbellbacteria bacterium]
MDKKDFKIPPQNIDAEKALLGSILVKSDSIYEIIELVTPDAFYAEKHKIIYQAIVELFNKNEPIDLLTLSTILKNKGVLESVGGEEYLAELSVAVPSATNIEHYAKIVQDKSIKRKIIKASENIAQIGFDEAEDTEVSVDLAEKEIFDISQSVGSSDFHSISDSIKDAYERLEKLQENEGKLRGVPTGFASLDYKLSGFQPSDLIILAARPSVGKTSLALDFARKIAVENQKTIAFFSLEMSKEQLIDRLLSAEAMIDSWKLRTGNIKEQADIDAIKDAAARLDSAKIFIDDNSYNNVLKMKSAARKLKRKHGLDLIIVDYLQLMAPIKTGKNSSPVQEVTEISRGLKQLAKELDVPVIALSQLSRNIEHRGENSEPRLADLRDSGSIEQDADVVMFIHRNKSEDDDKARELETKLIIEKHRNGATGVVNMYFNSDKTSFTELDEKHFAQVSSGSDDDFEF